jgi:hypothetical protein
VSKQSVAAFLKSGKTISENLAVVLENLVKGG